MKKVLALMLVFALVFTVVSAAGQPRGSQTAGQEFIPNVPNLHPADSEIAKDGQGFVRKITAERFKDLVSKSYMKPKPADRVKHLDVRGDHKGIAILVDFPVYDAQGNLVADDQNGKVSNVPGVNYERVPAGKFSDLLNGTEYNPYDLDMFKWLESYNGIPAPTNRTFKNYYDEVSYGQFSIDVDVVGWFTLPHDYNYYAGQNYEYNNEYGFTNMDLLVKDAIRLADDSGVDFSKYAVDAKPGDFSTLYGDATSFTDSNGNVIDKVVPDIFIIHRGTGAEYSMDPSVIWSHQWDILSAEMEGNYYRTGQPLENPAYTVVDGVALSLYDTCPEIGQDITGYLKYVYPDIFGPDYKGRIPSPPYPGVYIHEFGHILGLPDQYDYGYDSSGTGIFSPMCSGDTGGHINYRWYRDNTPVHMDAWSKMHLGFAQPTEINQEDGEQTITLRPSAQYPDIYKVNVPGSDGREYFLLENRQQVGYDEGMKCNPSGADLHGLEVYHVVDDLYARNPDRPNEGQNWDNDHLGKGQQGVDLFTGTDSTHYSFSVIQADGKYDLEYGMTDGDAEDVFPGTLNVTKISPKISEKVNTASVFKWDDKSTSTGIVIDNIVENADGTVTCTVYFEK